MRNAFSFFAVALVGASVVSLLVVGHAHPISKSCASTCDFHLCSPAKLSLLSVPSSPATPPICLEGRPVHVTSSGEAFVRSGASYYALISRTAPASTSKRCAPNFFTTFPTASGAAAVGFQPSAGTDYSFLAGKCVSLPLNSVQLVSPSGAVLHEMELEGRPLKDCVGFQVDDAVPPPPQAAEYHVGSAVPVAAGTPAPALANDDVSHGGRSALDARKRIMQTLGGGRGGGRGGGADHGGSAAHTPAADAEAAEVDDDGEPAPSAEPAELLEEPSASAEPAATEEAEAGSDEDNELQEAVPFSV